MVLDFETLDIKETKWESFNHAWKNLNGLKPQLETLPLIQIKKWYERSLLPTYWASMFQESTNDYERRNISSLLVTLLYDFIQVNFPPNSGTPPRSILPMKFPNLTISPMFTTTLCPFLSTLVLIALKSPATHHIPTNTFLFTSHNWLKNSFLF